MVGAEGGNFRLLHQLFSIYIDRHGVFLLPVEIKDRHEQADMGGADPVIFPYPIHEPKYGRLKVHAALLELLFLTWLFNRNFFLLFLGLFLFYFLLEGLLRFLLRRLDLLLLLLRDPFG